MTVALLLEETDLQLFRRFLWSKAALSCPIQYECAKSPGKGTQWLRLQVLALNWPYFTLWTLHNLCLAFVDMPPDLLASLLINPTGMWPWFSHFSNFQLRDFFFFSWPSTAQPNHLVFWHLLFDLKTLPHKQLPWAALLDTAQCLCSHSTSSVLAQEGKMLDIYEHSQRSLIGRNANLAMTPKTFYKKLYTNKYTNTKLKVKIMPNLSCANHF